MSERIVRSYTTWRHFKGFTAVVLGVAQHSETGEPMVIYYCMGHAGAGDHTDGLYARPLEMFLSEVDHAKYPDIQQKYRFEEVK